MNTFILFFQLSDILGSPFILIIAMVAIFYFLVFVPQKRQREELKNMVAELKISDEVVTNGGIIGKIVEVRETSFIIRSADKSLLEIGKAAVVGKRQDEVAEKK